ncbi:hypothetical protein FC18_GL000594 [Lacticaseibacillus sharpeae JCM 1186 = DSM 20505]|uniref:Uncharacterized protein n=1 Tax=Lacticaseibacillus sharpeae JCM 1186 = DSM 20505 TaxID=1291052 RepID=A0A0R1ZIW4_9LACO|nr:hypothetical protein FC18_GL000594 [Lacticaseibacillus sharpeae JCM 1186 = DSM 20505]
MNLSFRKTSRHTLIELEAQQMIDDVLTVFFNPKSEGMTTNFALSRFYGGFSRLLGLQNLQLAPETRQCWRRLFTFMNGPILKDFRGMGVPVGLA